MALDAESIKWMLGFFMSFLIFGFTIVRVLDAKAADRQDRMEKRQSEEMIAVRQELADKHFAMTKEIHSIHGRITDVKDRYVTQQTHERDINLIRTSISEFRSEMRHEITTGMTSFNNSLDGLRKDFTALLMDIATHIKKPHE